MKEIKSENETNVTKDSQINKGIIPWLIMLFAAGIIAIIMGVTNSNTKKEENTLGYVEGKDYSNSGISTYVYEHEVVHGDDIKSVTNDIRGILDYMKNNNAYIRVQVDESEFDYYIYNGNNECLAQSSDGGTSVVFRNNAESIAFGSVTGDVLLDNDADILKVVYNVLDIADSDVEDKNGVTVFNMLLDDSDTSEEYRVEIVGEELFKGIYKDTSDELGDNIIQTLKEQVQSISENEFVPHVIYTFLFNKENNDISIACELIVDDQEHINWLTDGYIELADWKLDDSWYSSDFKELTSDESFEMLGGLVDNIQILINNYAQENNIPIEEPEDTDNYESNTASESDGTDINSSTELETNDNNEDLSEDSEVENSSDTQIETSETNP